MEIDLGADGALIHPNTSHGRSLGDHADRRRRASTPPSARRSLFGRIELDTEIVDRVFSPLRVEQSGRDLDEFADRMRPSGRAAANEATFDGGYVAMDAESSILGKTDHASTVHRLLRSAEEGASLTLRSIPSSPRVLLVRRTGLDGTPELELGILCRDAAFAPLAKLSRRLEALRIPFSVEVRGRGARASGIRVCFSGPALEGELAGRVVDLALWAAGLRPGDEYIHRFGSGDDLDGEAGADLLGAR